MQGYWSQGKWFRTVGDPTFAEAFILTTCWSSRRFRSHHLHFIGIRCADSDGDDPLRLFQIGRLGADARVGGNWGHRQRGARRRTPPAISPKSAGQETRQQRAAPAIAKSNRRDEPRPALADAPVESQGDSIDPIQPPPVTSITFPTTPVQSASLAPMPELVPVAAPQPSAQVAARWLPLAPPTDVPMSAPATTVIEKGTLPLSRGGDPTIPNQPRVVKTITVKTRPALSPMPGLVPVAANAPQPSAQVAARWLAPAPPSDQPHTGVASAEPVPIARTPPALAFSEPAKLEPKKIEATKLAAARVELTKVETASAPVRSQIAASASAPPHAHDGWLIQIGAFDREDEATQHLSMARLKMPDALATANPLTERVQKGDKVLYRARFTGFNKETAEAACQRLRRSDTGCIALKDLN
jgi:D-alanyl-D-alanine carboxypeptidase